MIKPRFVHDPVNPAPNSDGLSSDVNEGGVKCLRIA
jgi:hypothetical protein